MPIRSTASEEFKLLSGSFQGWPHIKVGQRSLLVFHCDNQAPSSKANPLGREERIWMSSRITAEVHTQAYHEEPLRRQPRPLSTWPSQRSHSWLWGLPTSIPSNEAAYDQM